MMAEHADRVFVGLVLLVLFIMGQGMAMEFGFGIVESVVIGIVGPPAFFIGMVGTAWVLGTVAVHANKYIKIGERL